MAESRSTYCDECWPFHEAEVDRLTRELADAARQVRVLNRRHERELLRVKRSAEDNGE